MVRTYVSIHLNAEESDEMSAQLNEDEKYVRISLGTSLLFLDLQAFSVLVSTLNAVSLPRRTEIKRCQTLSE